MTCWQIRIQGKQHSSGGPHLLPNLSLDLEPGRFVALVGPSGVGKSTLLHILAGLDSDYAGSLRWGDDQARPQELGFVFQDPRLMPWLTVEQNLLLVQPQADRSAVQAILEAVGLAATVDQFPSQLSGGMQRRVALARACLLNPRWLLLDEPFSSLDAPAAQALHQVLLRLWQRTQAGVLLVTHDLREALSLADDIVFLSRSGQVLRRDSIELPRPRHPDSAAIAQAYHNLLSNHPGLLAGEETAA
jgi:NitT/TauT family transport system ATP-binding protein